MYEPVWLTPDELAQRWFPQVDLALALEGLEKMNKRPGFGPGYVKGKGYELADVRRHENGKLLNVYPPRRAALIILPARWMGFPPPPLPASPGESLTNLARNGGNIRRALGRKVAL